jgi:hypothetical protein
MASIHNVQIRNNSYMGKCLDGFVWATEYRNAKIYLKKNIPNTGVKVIRFINMESLLLQSCIIELENPVVRPSNVISL